MYRYFRRVVQMVTSDWKPFWRESYKKALILMVPILAIVGFVGRKHYFERVEVPGLDYLNRTQAREVPTDIFIVEITDDDYKHFFNSKSPLAPWEVLELITAIHSASPLVIGIDIDTQDDLWRCPEVEQKLSDLGLLNSGVVWAQVPSEEKKSRSEEPELYLQPVLGQWDDAPEIGVVRFPMDVDGVVRRYRPQYRLSFRGPKAEADVRKPQPRICHNNAVPEPVIVKPRCLTVLSFPREVRSAYCEAPPGQPCEKPATIKEPYLSFSRSHYEFQTVQASEFLEGNAQAKKLSEEQKNGLFQKIVLIGGNYGAARDEYQTPAGRMDGIELLATAIEAELHPTNGFIVEVPIPWGLSVDFVMGSLVVLIYFWNRYHPGRALRLVLALMAVPFLVSFDAFYDLGWWWLIVAPVMAGMAWGFVRWEHLTWRAFFILLGPMAAVLLGTSYFHHRGWRWLSFVPVMAGMLLHQLVEAASHAEKLHRELEAARADLMTAEDSLKDRIAEVEDLRLELARERRPPEKSRTATGGS